MRPENRDKTKLAAWLHKPVEGPLMVLQPPEYWAGVKQADRAKAEAEAKEKAWADWMYQNDKALYDLSTKDRVDDRFDFDLHYHKDGSVLYDNLPARVSVALLNLRGRALKLTRREMAAYCGITPRTAYNQEKINWVNEAKKPCAVYWQAVHRWGFQCYGHIDQYWQDLRELERWLPLLTLPAREYFPAKARMLGLNPHLQHPGIRPQKVYGLRKIKIGT